MTSTMITQPATTGTPIPTRPHRIAAFAKLVGLVMAIGTLVAVAVAAVVGVAALVLSSASG
jgi:hypothetical protein